MKETFLYRHFDADGKLLYVGISLSAITRLRQHREISPWFNQIRRVDIETHPDRDAAMNAEAKAISEESPKFNIKLGKYRPEKLPRITNENIRGLVSPHDFISHDRVCEILKVKSGHLTELFRKQKIGYCVSYYISKMNVGIVEHRGQHVIDYVEMCVR